MPAVTSPCAPQIGSRLNPVTSLGTSQYNFHPASHTPYCPQVISKGPQATLRQRFADVENPSPWTLESSLVTSEAPSPLTLPWQHFTHPLNGQSYFVLTNAFDFDFSVVTRSNVNEKQVVARIYDFLQLVKTELQDKRIQVPSTSRCELFLELAREDHPSCNYYFVRHVDKTLFWLEDVSTDALGIPVATSPLHLALERLYWMHLESYPMHHEQELSQVRDALYKTISRSQADKQMSKSMVSPSAEDCKEFLKLLSWDQGRCMDAYVLCRAAHFAGIIANPTVWPRGSDTQNQNSNAAGAEPNSMTQTDVELQRTVNSGIAEARVPMDDIRSNFPHDLTGCVTRFDTHPRTSGGFGNVYKGELCIKGKSTHVALKALRMYIQDYESLPKITKRFHREVNVWVKLEHPNVLQLFGIVWDSTMHPTIPAMVCPWAENGPLSTYLEFHTDLTVVQRLVLAGDVAHGLRYLHSQRVVHGDLSGSNVLIRANGSACISDFGLSTLLTAKGGSPFSSRQMMGALRWTAPELLSAHVDMSPTTQSDLYSFGSIMLQILTGHVPYHNLVRDPQVVAAIMARTRPDRGDQKMVTDTRWKFIQKCWSEEPDNRPTGEEIVAFTTQEYSGYATHEP